MNEIHFNPATVGMFYFLPFVGHIYSRTSGLDGIGFLVRTDSISARFFSAFKALFVLQLYGFGSEIFIGGIVFNL